MLTGLAQAEHYYDGMAQKYEEQALACMTELSRDPEKTMDHKKRNHQSFAYIVKSLAYLAYVPEKLLNHPSVDQGMFQKIHQQFSRFPRQFIYLITSSLQITPWRIPHNNLLA